MQHAIKNFVQHAKIFVEHPRKHTTILLSAMPKTSFSNNFHDFYPWITKYKAYICIASESIYNPRAFRALEQAEALDPSRKGPRASRTYMYIHAQYQDF